MIIFGFSGIILHPALYFLGPEYSERFALQRLLWASFQVFTVIFGFSDTDLPVALFFQSLHMARVFALQRLSWSIQSLTYFEFGFLRSIYPPWAQWRALFFWPAFCTLTPKSSHFFEIIFIWKIFFVISSKNINCNLTLS